MTLHVPPTSGANLGEWIRKAAAAINALISRPSGFDNFDADPADPKPGRTYFNTTTNKARTWDGSIWNDLW